MADTEVEAGCRQSVFGDGGNALFEREETWLLSVAIPIGDAEYTGLETKPHWYEPLAPEDASHGAVGRLRPWRDGRIGSQPDGPWRNRPFPKCRMVNSLTYICLEKYM